MTGNTPMENLGDRLVQSNQTSADRIVNTLDEAHAMAQEAVVSTAAATASIRRLTLASVLLSLAILLFSILFAVAFWRYAIVVRV